MREIFLVEVLQVMATTMVMEPFNIKEVVLDLVVILVGRLWWQCFTDLVGHDGLVEESEEEDEHVLPDLVDHNEVGNARIYFHVGRDDLAPLVFH